MAEALRNLIDTRVVHEAGLHLQRAWPDFPRERFEALALDGLATLGLKARAMQLADALEATLPDDFAAAAEVIEASLGPPGAGDDLGALATTDAGLAGWIGWPLGEFIARRGIHDPERALAVLHALTQRFSAEFAIRRFIARHPEIAFATLKRWTRDPSAHVRRLVSEGSRPRLPWGERLRAVAADPSPTLPLLEALQDDPSAYVRRSVANHLNDIAKDHPAIVAEWLERHLPGAPPQRVALLRHACRTLIKHGDPRVLAAFGSARPLRGSASLVVRPARIALGEAATLVVTLRSEAKRGQLLVIDYRIRHVGGARPPEATDGPLGRQRARASVGVSFGADGSASPKVFKGWTVELAPGEVRRIERRHPLRPITTRRYHPGRHLVELQVNGRVVAEAAFTLRL